MILKFKENTINNDSNFVFENKNYSFNKILNNLALKKKNLIIGVIKNYKWEVVAPFFTSFKKVGFDNCDCVIFVENITQEIINKIKNFDVRVIKIKGIIEANIINYRYKLYEDFLKNNPDKYNLVLAIDIRDSIFQKDIFKYYENNKSFLVLAIEDDYLTHPINKMWIIEAFGNNIYKIIENERIVCSGTILGSANKFIEFSSMIWKIANTNNYSRHNWNDQAIVNYLVYYKLFLNDCIIKNHNKDGLILTLATATPKSFFIDSESNILNGKGEIASVIHQYNRHQNIALRVIYKFCPELKKNILNNIIAILKGNDNYYLKTKLYFFILFIVIIFKFKKSSKIHIKINKLNFFSRK
jgi:hypothetical protein